MLVIFLNLFKSRKRPPRRLFLFGIFILRLVERLRKKTVALDLARFERSQWLDSHQSPEVNRHKPTESEKVDLVFVVTRKDFEVLEYSLPSAIKSLRSMSLKCIKLIVPQVDIEECERIFGKYDSRIQILNENEILSSMDRVILKEKFGFKYTWVLQQVLKVVAILSSESNYVLIVDADTILLRERNWVNAFGQQLLQPSEEFNPDYYSFLKQFGFCESSPEFTLVTHHMFFQREFMMDALLKLQLSSVSELISLINEKLINTSPSPICIDYEFYGQYMLKFQKARVVLEPWSNIAISISHLKTICNSPTRLKILGFFYNSASFHSWS